MQTRQTLLVFAFTTILSLSASGQRKCLYPKWDLGFAPTDTEMYVPFRLNWPNDRTLFPRLRLEEMDVFPASAEEVDYIVDEWNQEIIRIFVPSSEYKILFRRFERAKGKYPIKVVLKKNQSTDMIQQSLDCSAVFM